MVVLLFIRISCVAGCLLDLYNGIADFSFEA